MLLKKLIIKCLNYFDSVTQQKVTVSVGDIVNLRTEIENNQFLLTTRLLDIEDYCERSIQTFNWQNTISRKAYGEKHREQDGNNAFSKLIKSYQEKGYDSSSYFVVDSELRLLDGNHRMGMNLYMGIYKINVRVLKRKSRNPKAVDWYLKVGLDTEFIKSVADKFKMLQQKMMDTGNVFCAVVPTENLAKDISFLARDTRIDQYTDLPDNKIWGGGSIPSRGVLIRFTLYDPQYYVKDGKVISKRAEEIGKVIRLRTDDTVIITKNCLEGRQLFEIISPYFGKGE